MENCLIFPFCWSLFDFSRSVFQARTGLEMPELEVFTDRHTLLAELLGINERKKSFSSLSSDQKCGRLGHYQTPNLTDEADAASLEQAVGNGGGSISHPHLPRMKSWVAYLSSTANGWDLAVTQARFITSLEICSQ